MEFKPTDAKSLRDAIADALSAARPLELAAGASKRGFGHKVAAEDRLDLSALDRLVFYEPEELVLRVGPAMKMIELEALLSQRGQCLAFEPPDLGPLYGRPSDRGTIGGAIACNLGGPRRLKAGAARDHLLGFEAVSGRAEAFKSGGRVMKNVTGYDLSKLMAGSFGTLAALYEVTLRVQSLPDCAVSLALEGLNDDGGVAAMVAALGGPADISAAAHLPARIAAGLGLAAPTTLMRLEGSTASVAARLAGLEALLKDRPARQLRIEQEESAQLWRRIRDGAGIGEGAPDQSKASIWRVSLPPAQGADYMRALATRLKPLAHFYDWGGGLIWLAVAASEPGAGAAPIREGLMPFGGHATLLRPAPGLGAPPPIFQPEPPALAQLSTRIRAAFDPAGILNPGRMGARDG